MSVIQMQMNGLPTGKTAEKSHASEEDAVSNTETERPIYIKLTPGTDIYIKVLTVANKLDVNPTRAARYMMRNGWLGFKRFAVSEGIEVSK